MQPYKIFSFPLMVLAICCFFLIAYNLHNDSYEFFFDSEPIGTVMIEIKPEYIDLLSTFEQKPKKVKAHMPDHLNAIEHNLTESTYYFAEMQNR